MNGSQQPMYLELSNADQQKLEALLEKFERSWTLESLSQRMNQWPSDLKRLQFPALVEMVKIDLEHRWRVREPRKLEFYLKHYPELGTPETVLGELIEAEIEVIRQHGERANLADYQTRFPVARQSFPNGSRPKAPRQTGAAHPFGTRQAANRQLP